MYTELENMETKRQKSSTSTANNLSARKCHSGYATNRMLSFNMNLYPQKIDPVEEYPHTIYAGNVY